MSEAPYVIRSDAGAVATITLDRADRLNAFTGRDMVELRSVLRDVAAAPDVRAVVLTGAGRAFSAGGDLKAMAAGSAAGDRGGPLPPMRELVEVVELLNGMPKVTIAAVNGACAGAGLSLAAACDLRVAAPSAVFATAFAKVGQSGDFGGTWFLSRLVGRSRATALLLLSDRFDATTALDVGLVQEIADDAVARAQAIGRHISGLAPLTVAAIKENLRDAEVLDLSSYLDRETERFMATSATQDTKEAVRAFVEKRDPKFEGR